MPRMWRSRTMRAPKDRVSASRTANYTKTQSFLNKKRMRHANRTGYGSVARSRGAAVTGETKYYDAESTINAIVAVTATWAGTEADPETSINLGSAAVANPLTLCCPIVAATLNGRVGRQIELIKCKIRGTLSYATAAAQGSCFASQQVRLILLLDMQTNSAQFNAEDVQNGATLVSACFNSYQNPNFFGRFRVLRDKIIKLEPVASFNDAATTGSIGGQSRQFKFSVNCKGIVMRFNAVNAGTIGDVIDNSLHLIAGAALTTATPTISFYSRVSYKDI